jgi:hypothetical protein
MNVSDILADAQAARFVVQDFRPLAQSVEWQLGQAYLDRGSKAFAGDRHIPFAVNNDGNLSVDGAEVLFERLRAAEQHGTLAREIRVLELGPGLGLFARFFLDAFRALCRERGKDYYDRLTYVAADRSERMLADIARRGVFASRGKGDKSNYRPIVTAEFQLIGLIPFSGSGSLALAFAHSERPLAHSCQE